MSRLVVLSALIALHGCYVHAILPCGLEWGRAWTGNLLPPDTIHITFRETAPIPARLDLADGNGYVGGSYDLATDQAWFHLEGESSSASSHSTFEVLTNPHRCTLQWVSGGQNENYAFGVQINSAGGQTTYVGRVRRLSDATWVAGEINPVLGQITYVEGEETQVSTSFETLTTSSAGFLLEIGDFVFSETGFPLENTFLGVEVIVNRAEVFITEEINHSRVMEEVLSFPISNTNKTVSTNTELSNRDILFPSFLGANKKVTVETTYKELVEETLTTVTETEISLQKRVQVPPHSSVTICSTVSFADDVSVPYRARGVYSAPGLSPERVYEMLLAEGIEVVMVDGLPTVYVDGVLEGTLALETRFYAEETGATPNCDGVRAMKESERGRVETRLLRNLI